MVEIIKRREFLPETISRLSLYIFVKKEELKAYKAKLAAMVKAEIAKAQRDRTLEDAQDISSAVLWAEARLGELLPPPSFQRGKGGRIIGEKTLPPGISWKQSFYAQQLSSHPEIIENVILKAKENEKIPERWDVIKEIEQQKRQKSQTEIILPEGQYRTIVIDPPWPMEKTLREERPYQGIELDYQTMTIEAIKTLKLPCADECHVYLWATQKFLPISFQLFEDWDVKYIQTLVWHKNVGFTPFGLFMNNVEFVLFGRRGSLPLLKAGLKACFEGKVREHSRKPNEFYDLVRSVSPEPRIDVFSREKREGFEQLGDEIDKF